MLAFSRINDLKLKSRDVIAYADSLLTARGIDPSKLTAAAKAMTLYGDMVKEQLPKLMEFRNRIISDYMSFQHQDLAEGAFSISNVVLEEIMEYRGKDRYTVTLIIDDEEVELTPAESEEAEGETSEPSAEFDDEGAQESQTEETLSTNIAAEDNLSASEALEVSTDIE